jgi:hypothetical protein
MIATDKLERLVEVFNKRDDVVVDCTGIDFEDNDFAYCWLDAKELSIGSYKYLGELANKIALALYRRGIESISVELNWLWVQCLDERMDVIPKISIKMLCEDIDAVTETISGV